MKNWVLIPLLLVTSAFAEDRPKKYETSEIEHLKLQVKQKDAQIAQIYYMQSQQKYNDAVQELYKECTSIRDQHNWPATVTCKPEDLTFFDTPKEEPKKTEPKK